VDGQYTVLRYVPVLFTDIEHSVIALDTIKHLECSRRVGSIATVSVPVPCCPVPFNVLFR